MKRAKPIMPSRRPTPAELSELAERCEYVGSVEHKASRSWLGLPQPRRKKGGKGVDLDDHKQKASICPLVADKDRVLATGWVREAIRLGRFGNEWMGDFPRKVWYRDEAGQCWYGFLTNQGAGAQARGEYKGWPISEEEWREIFD